MLNKINSFTEYQKLYKKSVENPEGFWSDIASTFIWKKKWDKVLEGKFEDASVQWFVNGKLNITENCLDRHLEKQGHETALIWEPNDTHEEGIQYTYQELYEKVCQFANVLKENGAQKGDRICIYMPMIPELTIAVLACARIGAIHLVVFAGFSANAIADRIHDANCNMVITSDGMYRGIKKIAIKEIIDDALERVTSVEKVLVVKRTYQEVEMKEGRDIFVNEALEKASKSCPAEEMDAEDMLFILYTSGSTGKPKGVVHTCGGYMVHAEYSFRNVFQYEAKDIYWCTADIGWITGHTYLIYGPLLAGATTVMFEGIPTYPDAGRFWEIVEKYKVNLFYTAPTAIRALLAQGSDYVTKYDLSSLKVLGSVGEPINEEAWHWYDDFVGKNKCPIVDTWWQTETGGIMISPLAGITDTIPTYATFPLPGIQMALLDNDGKEIKENEKEGYLVIKFPWPSMIRTTYGDHQRCIDTYFKPYKGYYFTGDGAKREKNGMYHIIGRVDDVINVSGHRFGTAEIENAICEHPDIPEAAVVGYPHEIKGQGIYAYVVWEGDFLKKKDIVKKEIIAIVENKIGKIALPDNIQFVEELPKTSSGKIMRRILRKVAEGDPTNLGDITTLLEPKVVRSIIFGNYNLKSA